MLFLLAKSTQSTKLSTKSRPGEYFGPSGGIPASQCTRKENIETHFIRIIVCEIGLNSLLFAKRLKILQYQVNYLKLINPIGLY